MALPYELGEMKTETGEVLRYEVEATASELAISLSEIIQEYPVYQEILEKTRNAKTSLYFQNAIKEGIYSPVRDLCVLRWYRRNKMKTGAGNEAVSVPRTGVYLLLAKAWPDRDIPLRIMKESFNDHKEAYYRSLRSLARRLIDRSSAFYCRLKFGSHFRNFSDEKGCIAVQYVEGLDITRRCDLVWYPESRIDPARILIYFAWPDHEPVDEEVIKSIEAMGMKYVCMNRASAKNKNVPAWYPRKIGKKVPDLKARPENEIEKWIMNTGKKLVDEINYWSAFYKAFNVNLHFIAGGRDSKYIAQGIAFGLNGSRGGLVMGKERSELQWPPVCILGWYPVDVFFTWTPRAAKYLRPNVNRMITSISTGYSNDVIFTRKKIDAEKLKSILRSRGVDYSIALFDNAHGSDIAHSTVNMEKFYLAFLTWLLEDPGIGILIKSKKPSVLQRLPRVLSVLEKVEATGRCIRLGEEFGRLPIDASLTSDIAVGIGISSAVIESAIAGCRGVHCDLTNFRSHEFYKWGYERIIFDNLDRLMSALKGHRAGIGDYAALGDWTCFLDRLDPFHDGHAGERMGAYLRWCLEGFDEGLNRDEVIRRASKKYEDQWGSDKVVML